MLVGAAALQVLAIRHMFGDGSGGRRVPGNRIIKGLMDGGSNLPLAARRTRLDRL